MPKIIRLSAEFMRKYPALLSTLWPMEQKLWFVPFLGTYNLSDEVLSEARTKDIAFGIPLHQVREFLGTKQSDVELRRFIKKVYPLLSGLYQSHGDIPFRFHEIKRNVVYFKVGNYYAFSNFSARKQFFAFDLDEIASYKIERKKKTTPIPFVWYLLSHKHKDKENNCWEVNLSDSQLKALLRLDKYDYLHVPEGKREFFVEVDNYYMNLQHSINAAEQMEYVRKLMEKYGFNKQYEMVDEHTRLCKLVKFKRWDFEEKALLPILYEVNSGHTINLIPQEVYIRGAKGQKASKGKSYIGKNYEFYADGMAVITANGSIITKNITNFRKLQCGKQYTFKFNVANLYDKSVFEESAEKEFKFEARYWKDDELRIINECENVCEADIYNYFEEDPFTEEELAYWDKRIEQESWDEYTEPPSWL